MNRVRFLASAAAAGGCAAAFGARASAAAATVTTQLLWVEDVEYAGWWLADAQGEFARAGITSNVLAGGPNLASVEAIVASGRADVGVDEFEKVVDAVTRGTDLIVVGAAYQTGLAGFLSLPKNPVRRAADLVGKRIGLAPRDHDYVAGVLRLNHLPATFTEVPVGFDPQALVEGACDAYLCYVTAQPLVLRRQNIPYVLATFADMGYATYADTIFCTRAWAEQNRDLLVGYLRALGAGWLTNARDPAVAAKLAVTRYGSGLGLDLQQQIEQNQVQIPYTQSALTRRYGPLWLSESSIATRVYATLRATGRSQLPDLRRLVDLSYLRAANGRTHPR
jgi:ABC-type nitrate/sulfonate/bicarbonate transport system substrate-binding protein